MRGSREETGRSSAAHKAVILLQSHQQNNQQLWLLSKRMVAATESKEQTVTEGCVKSKIHYNLWKKNDENNTTRGGHVDILQQWFLSLSKTKNTKMWVID